MTWCRCSANAEGKDKSIPNGNMHSFTHSTLELGPILSLKGYNFGEMDVSKQRIAAPEL